MPFMTFTGTGYTPLRPRSLELLEDRVYKETAKIDTFLLRNQVGYHVLRMRKPNFGGT